MALTVNFTITGISSLSQSRPILIDRLPNEGNDDFRTRTWREHLHANEQGEAFIPPGAIKNCLSEAAKFMNVQIPGKNKATYTKHVEAGVMCMKPLMLGVNKRDVKSETLFLPASGRRGDGKRVWKTYPVIPVWGGDVELIVLDETVLQTSKQSGNPILQDFAEGAGQYIGLGRNRPRNNGWYGRFTVGNFAVSQLSLAA